MKSLLILALFLTISVSAENKIESISLLTSDCLFCGMSIDGVSLKICGTWSCCYTPWLSGDFDAGESDYFVGRQLGECFDYTVMNEYEGEPSMGKCISKYGL